MQKALAYTIALISALAGILNAPFWASLVCGSALGLISIRDQAKLRDRFAALSATHVLSNAHLASLADGCLVAVLAWLLGLAFRFALLAV